MSYGRVRRRKFVGNFSILLPRKDRRFSDYSVEITVVGIRYYAKVRRLFKTQNQGWKKTVFGKKF